MTWAADVPFPAEDLGKCRGCGATIGWVRKLDEATGERKAHPVEPKGWHGQACGSGCAGAVRGYDRDGDPGACRPFGAAALFPEPGVVIFESHFKRCPEASKYWARKREAGST